jgi:hypothetical protein
MMSDTPGGRCFSFLEWSTEELAICVERYADKPAILEVSQGKELRAMILARRQFLMTCGLDQELGADPTLDEAMRWIEQSGGFGRDRRGNWKFARTGGLNERIGNNDRRNFAALP